MDNSKPPLTPGEELRRRMDRVEVSSRIPFPGVRRAAGSLEFVGLLAACPAGRESLS
jgi:hypothetical protein